MSKLPQRVAGLLVVLVVVGGVALVRSRHRAARGPAVGVEDNEDDRSRRWRGFAAAEPGPGGGAPEPIAPGTPGATPLPSLPSPGPAEAPDKMARDDEALIDRWRQGILLKNREAVLDCDETFMTAPPRYGPQLEVLAESEPDDRVRAFSTRVLGKYKNVAAVGVFQRLLADRSEYVRQNAAWALGELSVRPQGRQAASPALGELQRLQESDPAPDVRTAAAVALKKLQ